VVVVCGALLSVLAVGYVRSLPGVYWSQVNVLFLLPQNDATPNSLQFQNDSLVSLAGIVGKSSSVGGARSAPTSDGVTLVGEGIYNGYSMDLPNSGGQWAINYDRPLLDVQASGSTPEEVTARMKAVIARIEENLADRQAKAGVSERSLVTTRLSPPVMPMYYNPGSHVRAMGATLLLCLSGTAVAVVVVDRRRARRRVGRDPAAVRALVPG
jgi:hypothetical protein